MKCGASHMTGLLAPFGQMDVAFDVDQPAQPRRRRVPEQAALEQAAAEPAEMLLRKAHARLGRELGKAELEVAQRDTRREATTCQPSRPSSIAEHRLHASGSQLQQPKGRKQQPRAQEFASVVQAAQRPLRAGRTRTRVSGVRFSRCETAQRPRPRARSSKRPVGGPGTTFPIIAASPSY